LAGLITTIVNIYTARGGFWSGLAIGTAVVTGSCVSVMMTLFLVHGIWKLGNIKKEHNRLKEEARLKQEAEKYFVSLGGR
jgi:hypothetical protein